VRIAQFSLRRFAEFCHASVGHGECLSGVERELHGEAWNFVLAASLGRLGGLSGKEFDTAHHVRSRFSRRNYDPMNKLTGKVAVVTGASKGIGGAIAKSLAAEGASVVVNYASSKAGADTVVAAITAAGNKAVAVPGDVSKAGEAQGIIEAAIKNYGRLDILVNNSGVYEFAPIETITEEHFHRHFNINVLGLLLVTQAAVKYLGEGGQHNQHWLCCQSHQISEQRGLLRQ
jgi:short subunit dehydrogenase